ncbi:hypothetical protein [Rhodococcus sp. NPDC058514]|uniref:hypothetical protein n=1 Tax=unclassified Rhodococcus (in: high G+C Gram-positive bacteria) TaxID=192944 RepID=UPI00364A82F5
MEPTKQENLQWTPQPKGLMMTFRLVPTLTAAAVVTSAILMSACSPESNPLDVTPTDEVSQQRYFAEPPVDVPRDPSATCLDADLPNITVDDSIAYWQTIFDDQRSHYPEQPFPSNQDLESQKRAEWSQVVNDAAPPDGDARFARDVCGLIQLDGSLYSGVPLRQVRGHVAEFGRRACTSIAEQGTLGLWQSLQGQEPDRAKATSYEYLIHSAITNVCPQLAEPTTPPTQIEKCADLTPDPSARPEEGVFCLN